MRFAFYTNLVSPHTAPLAKALIAKYGEGVYVCQQHGGEPMRTSNILGGLEPNTLFECDSPEKVRSILESCDILLTGVRDFDLIQERINRGLFTAYQSERWFKPESLLSLGRSENGGCGLWVSGFWKMLLPFAFRRAKRIMQLFKSDKFVYLPIGVHAARDMARLCGLFAGDIRCLFSAPELGFEKTSGGSIFSRVEMERGRKFCLDKMRMWGYYVEPSRKDALPVQEANNTSLTTNDYRLTTIRVLWVGRLLNWKRVDTIVRAVGEHANLKRVDDSLPKMTLDIYGTGPEECQLKKMAAKYGDIIKFYPAVPITEVRKLMREHNVYVLSSNAFEGWGAVVNEALEEGMRVLGTRESGSSATILPKSNLFNAGDWRKLSRLLGSSVPDVNIQEWSVDSAARAFVELAGGVGDVK